MQAFEYIRANSLADLVSALSGETDGARILCGGTDLLVQLRAGRRSARRLVDIKPVPEANALAFDPVEGLLLGAAVSCYRIGRSPVMLQHFPGLVDAVALIGGIQIQGRASLGGNLCNASPAADSIPALIAHHASCQVVGPQGTRWVEVERFCTGPGQTILEAEEFLVALRLPPPTPRFGAAYVRFTPRGEMDIAVAGAGASVVLDESLTRIVSARLALGAVAPVPLFVPEAGECLTGKPVSARSVEEAARLAQSATRPIDDWRGTAAQRKHLAFVLARRALEKALQRAGAVYAS